MNMKLSTMKKKKAAKLFVSLATTALMLAVFTVVACAAGGAPAGDTGAEAAYQSTINFFITWFRRVGMVVAFVGAIMFALAIKNDDADRKQAGLVTMVAGFVVVALCAASSMFDLFT